MIGRRGTMLILLALVYASLGYSYVNGSATTQTRQGLHFPLLFAPLWLLGIVWIGAALIALVSSVLPAGRDAPAYGLLAVLSIMWAIAYWSATLFGYSSRSWVNGFLFAAFAGVIITCAGWREPPDLRSLA